MNEELAKYETKEKTGLPEVKMETEKISIQDQIVSLIPLVGTIQLTEEQEKVLYSPVVTEDIEIRPDGLIYLPWMEYVTRLRRAFGMSWGLIPYGPPKKLGNFIHWGFWLIIQGKPYGFAVGEQQYFENERMTYGDALEGAKSNALMRLCKGLGISLELWKPSFVKEWKAKFAETYDEKGKTKWRKKGTNGKPELETYSEEPSKEPPDPGSPSSGKKADIVPITEQQKKLIFAKLYEKNIPLDDLEGAMSKKIDSFSKYPNTNEALDWIGKQAKR